MRFLSDLLSVLIPPRGTEKVVSRLELEELRSLLREGTLPYADPRAKALIWELKYHRNRRALELASILLADELMGNLGEDMLEPPLLIPIPMHRERQRARGFNHMEALCGRILKRLPPSAVRYEPDALVKQKETPRQVTLTAAARIANVQGSFAVPGDALVSGRTCIVLDDVTTTGATLAEAAATLRRAGAREVVALTLAR